VQIEVEDPAVVDQDEVEVAEHGPLVRSGAGVEAARLEKAGSLDL